MTDVVKQLKLKDARVLDAPYGELPDLDAVDWTRDVVFTWNGTTSGVRVPNGDWIAADRQGLTICDATSRRLRHGPAAGPSSMSSPGPGRRCWAARRAHGMLALSPRAVGAAGELHAALAAAEDLPPDHGRQAHRGHLQGRDDQHAVACSASRTRSTGCAGPRASAACRALIARTEANLAARRRLGRASAGRGSFLAEDPAPLLHLDLPEDHRALVHRARAPTGQADVAKKIAALLEKEGVAYDIGAYRDAPPGLRIWGGATVETSDLDALMPWLDWALEQVEAEHASPKAAE